VNFAPVERGQPLTTSSSVDHELNADDQYAESVESTESTDSSLSVRYAEVSGAILFPKYPPRDDQGLALDPRPKEICRIIRPLDGHPLELWGDE
jgi:hypothetical protein